ncbi:MAG: hypothetical protein ACPG8W_11755 [Candidatus Promineifilaceae bacterium]
MNELIWQSMKQQNMMHHVIYIVANISVLIVVIQQFQRKGRVFSRWNRLLILLLINIVTFAWIVSIGWAAEVYRQERAELGNYLGTTLGTFFIMIFARALPAGSGALLLRTVFRRKDS